MRSYYLFGCGPAALGNVLASRPLRETEDRSNTLAIHKKATAAVSSVDRESTFIRSTHRAFCKPKCAAHFF